MPCSLNVECFLRERTNINETIIAAEPSTKNHANARDPEMY